MEYIVKENETIEDIANKFNINKEDIENNNDFFSNKLIPGQIIMLPIDNFSVFDEYSVIEGDTLYEIANSNNIDINLLANINGINSNDYLYTGQILNIPKKNFNYYITTSLDTLDNVISKMNSNYDDIIDLNKDIYLLPEQLIVSKK